MVLIMEYVSGGELTTYAEDRATKGYGLTETEVRKIFVQLTDPVDYCHSHFVFHRHLQPENVLLADPDILRLTIIDFGLAGD